MNMNVNLENHLSTIERVNLGSYYTPSRYVKLVAEWLNKYKIPQDSIIADLSCGYGAFFELHDFFPSCKYIGNDIDHEALTNAKKNFPFISDYNFNALKNINRKLYNITKTDKLIIVGNPPYNDTTSLVGRHIKTERCEMDSDVKTRDLGISSLLAYDKLGADYVAVLHPLSYMIKKSNFKLCNQFFCNYELLEHLVFSSQEFSGTSSLTAFPVIVALYRRNMMRGLSYNSIEHLHFHTAENVTFCLSERTYITNFIQKYPHKARYSPEILFYTQRDINALKRCRTFIKNRIPNAVDVNPDQLDFYCYIDCFKMFANIPYWLGNFDVPFIEKDFSHYKDDFITVSKYYHRDIFGECSVPEAACINRVKNYINNVVSFSPCKE